MDAAEFAKIVADIQVTKSHNVNGALLLNLIKPRLKCGISVAGNINPSPKQKKVELRDCFNGMIRAIATHVGFDGDVEQFYTTTSYDAEQHVVIPRFDPVSKDYVYIRSKRVYNNIGSKKGTATSRKGDNTNMKNRKVTLTLITLASGFPLTLQITGSNKDATAWTRFCDPDLSKAEYDNITWTKDIESTNKAAVAAVNDMIQIEEDYAAGKLNKDAALEQFCAKYIEWVIAHLITNPGFIERRIPDLNVEGDLMAAYKDDAASPEDEPEAETEDETEEKPEAEAAE